VTLQQKARHADPFHGSRGHLREYRQARTRLAACVRELCEVPYDTADALAQARLLGLTRAALLVRRQLLARRVERLVRVAIAFVAIAGARRTATTPAAAAAAATTTAAWLRAHHGGHAGGQRGKVAVGHGKCPRHGTGCGDCRRRRRSGSIGEYSGQGQGR